MHFLIADGSRVVRSALRLLLEHHLTGVEVWEAASLTEVKRVIEQHTIDYALIDWTLMPEGGKAVLTHVRDRQPQSRTIVLSGRPEIAPEALQAGADAFVSKGDPPDHLLSILCDLIACAALASESQDPSCGDRDAVPHPHGGERRTTIQTVSARGLSPLAA
jgi:DNA-binding NarL/FixJ family response regulator